MQTRVIDQAWPDLELESVPECPACSASKATPEQEDVKDWAFHCAPGSWTYWRCKGCRSLFLNPRPTVQSIGKAYGTYYTHETAASRTGLISSLIEKLRHECEFHWLGIDATPRLHLRSGALLGAFRPFFKQKFPLNALKGSSPGRLLDIGCGNGDLMVSAMAMGHRAEGIEIDPAAVEAATARGLRVRQGSFDLLREHPSEFDTIICSHVIEHVHQPRELLQLILGAVKPDGQVFIAWPNPDSLALRFFGIHWRGLEAPRHLCLMSRAAISDLLRNVAATDVRFHASGIHTFGESWTIRHQNSNVVIKLLNKLIYFFTSLTGPTASQDFITVSFLRPQDTSPTSMREEGSMGISDEVLL